MVKQADSYEKSLRINFWVNEKRDQEKMGNYKPKTKFAYVIELKFQTYGT